MSFEQRLSAGSAVFGIVGLGYVGLPLAVEMAKAGRKVIGMDISQDKVDRVNAGDSYIPDVPAADLAEQVGAGLIEASTDFARASECDAVVICVPTPLNEMKEPDTSFMEAAARQIAPHLKPGSLVTLESTTYPGTTEEIVQPILEAHGLRVGTDLALAFSPERVDPGNPVYQTKNTPKVVGGVTPECTASAVAFYESFLDTIVPVSSTRAAEMTKLLENIFRCVNIALMNELLQVSERMGINIWEVVDAAKTKPFGFMPFYPGPGLGGHCIPIDPFYLAWKARQFDMHTEFIELAGKTNEAMPYYVVKRLMEALNSQRKPLAGSRILVLGVAYKANIDDMRESPAIKIVELLLDAEADVVYHDPFVPAFCVKGTEIDSVELTDETIAGADAAVIVTNHGNVDYERVWRSSKFILDTRNALKEYDGEKVSVSKTAEQESERQIAEVTAYIHPTALVNPSFTPSPFTIVDEGVAIFEGVAIGSFVHVRAGAKLRQGCAIGDHVTICENVDLGEGCIVGDFALVGRFPDFIEEGQTPPEGTTIGAGSVIGSHTVIQAGAVLGTKCIVGDNAVVAGACVLADESEVAMGVVALGDE